MICSWCLYDCIEIKSLTNRFFDREWINDTKLYSHGFLSLLLLLLLQTLHLLCATTVYAAVLVDNVDSDDDFDDGDDN